MPKRYQNVSTCRWQRRGTLCQNVRAQTGAQAGVRGLAVGTERNFRNVLKTTKPLRHVLFSRSALCATLDIYEFNIIVELPGLKGARPLQERCLRQLKSLKKVQSQKLFLFIRTLSCKNLYFLFFRLETGKWKNYIPVVNFWRAATLPSCYINVKIIACYVIN
jgi:hypothetical protein